MPATFSVTATPHWFNGWFLRLLATPVFRIGAPSGNNGIERTASWGRATTIEVTPGTYTVSVGVRYRGTRSVLGIDPATVRVAAGERVLVTAQNGPLNHHPFVIRIAR